LKKKSEELKKKKTKLMVEEVGMVMENEGRNLSRKEKVRGVCGKVEEKERNWKILEEI